MEFPRIKLKPKIQSIILEWLFIVMFMNAMMYLYFYITWWGLMDYLGDHAFEAYLQSHWVHLEILLQGTLFGLLFGLINWLADNTAIRKRSFGAIILVKSFLYTVAMIFSQWFVYGVFHIFNILAVEMMVDMQRDISPRFLLSITLYFILAILILNFILQIIRKFGVRDLLAMISGKYHSPTKENRIFLFLDMKDSTGMAERLGHYQYSRLIQQCIHDLTDLILRYKAQVYQYVGDEVVLSWPTKSGIRDNNFILLFYAFEQRLRDKREFYLNKFGEAPEFKAGADEGIITVTEVGDIKREIAYHGEVLHTAARLEKLCNKLGNNLLITDSLRSKIAVNEKFSNYLIGEYKLRGKIEAEKVFGVRRVA